jgi:KaiC/GvpD/RAD55 family RecA-like ATPase
MSIKIKHNKALDLKIPEFTCDGSLGDHLNNYDMLKFLNGYRFSAFIGKPGSGKTSLLVSFLTGKKDKKVFRNVFDHVLLVMPSSSRNSMKKNIFKKHHEDKMFDELSFGTIANIHDKLLKASSENENTLLILDDVGASLKNIEIQKILKEIIYNRRHLKVHIVILLQSFISCPLEVRKLLNNIFMFKPSKIEFENLFNELFETKKDLALDIMNIAYNKPHQYLMLNVDSQRMFRGFDEIIVDNEDSEN